jgi:hypothetical protein
MMHIDTNQAAPKMQDAPAQNIPAQGETTMAAYAQVRAAQLGSAIVATTLDPMDYLTNARGSTRPNSFIGADTCHSSHTIGMHPAQKASVCASMSANSLYQQEQKYTNGFFQPPYNM